MPARPLYTVTPEGWPQVDIGLMRHCIKIQQQGNGTRVGEFDIGGAIPSDWQDLFTGVMAAIEVMRGTDVIRSGQTTTQLFITVVIWFIPDPVNPYAPGVTSNMRVISDNGSAYVIQSVENVLELNVILVLNCLALGQNA
jgi:hypothetical protein